MIHSDRYPDVFTYDPYVSNFMPISTNTHHILTKDELRCVINALDVLDELVNRREINACVLDDLRIFFPPAAIEQARSKFL